MTMIRISNLNKVFNPGSPDQVVALKEVDLEIAEHDFVTVIGTNGSGKSTLLSAIAGNVIPDSGSLVIGGRNVTRASDFQRARDISRVFQNPYTGTAPGMTIGENLLMAYLRGHGRYPVFSLNGNLRKTFREYLASLGMQMEDRMDNIIGTLSGGQRQAITLLMAVLRTPKVLLLDEHTAALDPKSAGQIIRLTQRFVSEHRITTLMVTHSMQQALEMGNRTIMMHHGRIIEDIPETERKTLSVDHLLAKFEDIRKVERLTPQLLETLTKQYI